MVKKSISLSKVLSYLKEHGSAVTAKWYSEMLAMPIKNAQYMIAYRVFTEYKENEEFDDSIIDITLCRYLWQKFVNDEQIAEIVEVALQKNKFERKRELNTLLYDLNIEYPKSERIIDAIYFVVPELRTANEAASEEITNLVFERLVVEITAACNNKGQSEDNYYEKEEEEEDDDNEYERYEDGSPSEIWYHYFNNSQNEND